MKRHVIVITLVSMISIKKQNDSQKEPLQWKLLARWCFDSHSIKCPLKSPETVADAAAESQQILPPQKHTSAGSRQLNASLPESKAMLWHCFRLRPPNIYQTAQVNRTYRSDSLAVQFNNQNITAIIIVCINKFHYTTKTNLSGQRGKFVLRTMNRSTNSPPLTTDSNPEHRVLILINKLINISIDIDFVCFY